jgi:hypothetical protein
MSLRLSLIGFRVDFTGLVRFGPLILAACFWYIVPAYMDRRLQRNVRFIESRVNQAIAAVNTFWLFASTVAVVVFCLVPKSDVPGPERGSDALLYIILWLCCGVPALPTCCFVAFILLRNEVRISRQGPT